MDPVPTPPPVKHSVNNRQLLISLSVGAIPLAALGAILLFTPKSDSGPSARPAIKPHPEKPAETAGSAPLFDKSQRIEKAQNHYEKKRQLVAEIWKQESRMEDRVRRVRDDTSTNEKTKLQLLGELAVRAGNASLDESREMLGAVYAMPEGPLRYSLINGVLAARVEIEPEEALKLCGVLQDVREQIAARAFVVRHWALSDFDQATRAIEKLALPEERALATTGLLEVAASRPKELERVMARKDLSSDVAEPLANAYARSWTGNLEDLKNAVPGHAKPGVMAALMAGYGSNHPREALPYLQENPQSKIGEVAIMRIGDRLSGDDAHGSLDSVLAGPDFAERKKLVAAIFYGWMRRDLKESGNWLRQNENKLGTGGQADDLKLQMARTMKSAGAEESARAWAEKISDAKSREAALKEMK